MIQEFYCWVYPKKMKALIMKDTGNPVFIAALFMIAIYRSNISVHQQMTG